MREDETSRTPMITSKGTDAVFVILTESLCRHVAPSLREACSMPFRSSFGRESFTSDLPL